MQNQVSSKRVATPNIASLEIVSEKTAQALFFFFSKRLYQPVG